MAALQIEPLGDAAAIVRCRDSATAQALARALVSAAPAWLQDAVPAYAAVGVYFDPLCSTLADVGEYLHAITPADNAPPATGARHRVPVCYALGLDHALITDTLQLDIPEVIALHCSRAYTVMAIGFVPGFPYLAELPEALRGLPRLATPRVQVEAGSVGLTGVQTGIYPLPRPGGWPILGRTPLTIVEESDDYFPIRVGDTVQFHAIDEDEYQRRFGEKLESKFRTRSRPE